MLPIEYDEQVEIECAIIRDARRSSILAVGFKQGVAKGWKGYCQEMDLNLSIHLTNWQVRVRGNPPAIEL